MKFNNLSTAQIAALNVRPYPGYPEYTLLDLPGGQPPGFRRGASDENLRIPEAEVWQRFLREHYCPPAATRLLILHQCSWGKPYDMSATLQPVAELCQRYPFAHRVVVSNVGLIPQELQMNPIFCSYDWISLDGPEPAALTTEFHRLFDERLGLYLDAQRTHYAGILAIAERQSGSKLPLIARHAERLGMPLLVVPDQAGWRQTTDRVYRDPGDRIRHPVVLEQLRQMLERVTEQWQRCGVMAGLVDDCTLTAGIR